MRKMTNETMDTSGIQGAPVRNAANPCLRHRELLGGIQRPRSQSHVLVHASLPSPMGLSTSGKECWPTWNTTSMHSMWGDMAVMTHCRVTKAWDQLHRKWLISLFSMGLLVSPPGTQRWFLSLGPLQATFAWAWPVDLVRVKHAVFVRLLRIADATQLHTCTCTSLDGWRAMATEWISPLRFQTVARETAQAFTHGAVQLRCIGKPEPLFVCAARQAFGDAPLLVLQRLCEHRGLGACGDKSLFECLQMLICNALPGIEPDALKRVMALRMRERGFETTDLFATDAAREAFDRSDAQVLKEHEAQAKAAAADAEPYMTAFQAHFGAGAAKGRKKPVKWPTHLTQEFARELCPPSCAIRKDTYNSRWFGCCSMLSATISRSWHLHGDRRALLLVLHQCWTWEQQLTGMVCPHTW